MNILSNFAENLKEVITEKNISVEDFAKTVDIAFAEVYRYLRADYMPKFANLIKIADTFNLSVDFLFGLNEFSYKTNFKSTPPFHESFQKILSEKNITRYRIGKETNISINRLDDWYKGKFNPSCENLVTLANLFDCSVDYLLGRE